MAASQANQRLLETKVVILGHTGVGKTGMLNQFVRGSFTGQTTATIGATFMKKTIVIDDWHVILQIWDTAGQERFRSMAPMYYRGAHAAVLVFDVTSADTLDKVGGWVEELSGHASEDLVLVLAANKADLATPSSYPSSLAQSAQHYAKSIHAAYFETSAKTGAGIEPLFMYVASTLLRMHREKEEREHRGMEERHGRKGEIRLEWRDEREAEQGGCC